MNFSVEFVLELTKSVSFNYVVESAGFKTESRTDAYKIKTWGVVSVSFTWDQNSSLYNARFNYNTMNLGTYNLESIPIIDDMAYEHSIGCYSYNGLMYEFKIFASPTRDKPGNKICGPKFC